MHGEKKTNCVGRCPGDRSADGGCGRKSRRGINPGPGSPRAGLNGTALVRCGEAVISGSRPTWARGAAATAPRWPLPRGGGERCGVCVRRRPPPRAAASAASATRASSRRRRGPGDHRGKTRGWLALSGLCQHRHCRETRRSEQVERLAAAAAVCRRVLRGPRNDQTTAGAAAQYRKGRADAAALERWASRRETGPLG